MGEDLITTAELAALCGVTRQTVYRWIRGQVVTPDQTAGRYSYFTRDHAAEIAASYTAARESSASWAWPKEGR